jgi:uncharacterized protein (TIGR02300 family)
MGRPELGTKLACTGCSERFYDLNRSPAVCPKCGVQQPLPKPRVYSKPGESWRPRRHFTPIAADTDDRNAVVLSEAEDTEEAAKADSDADSESDEEAGEDERASFEGGT